MTTLTDVVASHRIVISAGSGGVGKTTVAATIALWGALSGRRTVVLTIDPARRLATSLGLGAIGNAPHEIPASFFAEHGLRPKGTLAAMMLDQKGAWDALVERHAPAEAKERILANRFYQHLSQAFAGSQEYMAIEQLCVLADSGSWDLIVVDTPPTRHALDFLDAPRRIDGFLDRKVVKWFVRPYFSAGLSAFRAVNRTASFLLRRLEQATGVSALVEISDFFTSMSGLFENFHGRVERAYEVLRGEQTAFVLVTGPEEQVLEDAEYLSGKMAELRMPLKGVVLNRVHREWRPPARGGRRAEVVRRTSCGSRRSSPARSGRRRPPRRRRSPRTSSTTSSSRAAIRSGWSSSGSAYRRGVPSSTCRTSRATCTTSRASPRCTRTSSGRARRLTGRVGGDACGRRIGRYSSARAA